MTATSEIMDIALRISEYNLRVNKYLNQSIIDVPDNDEFKFLITEKEKLSVIFMSRFNGVDPEGLLADIRKRTKVKIEYGELLRQINNRIQLSMSEVPSFMEGSEDKESLC